MLESSRQKTSLFTKRGHTSLVVVREHLVSKNSVSDLWRILKVHLEKPRLQMALLGLIVREHIKQEGRCLLDHALCLEDVYCSVNIDQTGVFTSNAGSKLGSLLRVCPIPNVSSGPVIRCPSETYRVTC